MLTSFIEALPEKVRSAEYKDEGTRFRRKEKALAYRYVELNQLYKKFIALDIDIPGSAFFWDERGLPPPSIIVINPENAHCQYFYELKTPVYYTEEARRAPQKFYEATDIALTHMLGADLGFTGHLVKNPIHPYWHTICHNNKVDLEDFQDYGVDLRAYKRKLALRESGIGRNTTLFDTLRHWAYVEVKKYPSLAAFQASVDTKALTINGHFIDHLNSVLPAKEVLSTAKSVGKWTWKHRNRIGNQKNRGVLELPEDMPIKDKQAQGAAYTNVVRTEAIDDTIKLAIHTCKQRGLKINSGNLGKCGLSMSTYYKHKDAVSNWIRLLS
ncbi:replication initiation protein [Comamonas suwonensis]|uniref:replication initiation protein n=1 Tax=Comamonas suwonensis TaxID=2606214 RepID=UPI00145D2260|nr:replication initiation protein [Comamonas suwonensis]MBI1624942.1 replication initiation protein [Comamonas suwonensis]